MGILPDIAQALRKAPASVQEEVMSLGCLQGGPNETSYACSLRLQRAAHARVNAMPVASFKEEFSKAAAIAKNVEVFIQENNLIPQVAQQLRTAPSPVQKEVIAQGKCHPRLHPNKSYLAASQACALRLQKAVQARADASMHRVGASQSALFHDASQSRAAAPQSVRSASSASQSFQPAGLGTSQLPFGASQFQLGASRVLMFREVQVECLAGGMQPGPMMGMGMQPMNGAAMMGMGVPMMGICPSMMGAYGYGRSGN